MQQPCLYPEFGRCFIVVAGDSLPAAGSRPGSSGSSSSSSNNGASHNGTECPTNSQTAISSQQQQQQQQCATWRQTSAELPSSSSSGSSKRAVVVGGGWAGFGAALALAKAGAQVINLHIPSFLMVACQCNAAACAVRTIQQNQSLFSTQNSQTKVQAF
jgi:hypothetical protein